MRFSITMLSLSGVLNKIIGDNFTFLDTIGHVHGSRVSSSLHQAVTWSLLSPSYNDTFHLTGVHIFFLTKVFLTLLLHIRTTLPTNSTRLSPPSQRQLPPLQTIEDASY